VDLVEGVGNRVCLAMAVAVPICLDVSFPCAAMGPWLCGLCGTNAISRLLATSRWRAKRFRRHRLVRTAVVAICPAQLRSTHFHSTQSLAATAPALVVHFFSYVYPLCSTISLGSESLSCSNPSIVVKSDGKNCHNLVWFGWSLIEVLTVVRRVLATTEYSLEPVDTKHSDDWDWCTAVRTRLHENEFAKQPVPQYKE